MSVASDPGRVPRRRLIPRFVALDLSLAWRRWLRRRGWLTLAEAGVEVITPPDTALVRAAFDLARETSPPYVFNHAARCWAFSAAFAQRYQLKVDREALCVAAILHDLGLTDGLAAEPGSFEWVGARAAQQFCLKHGVSVIRADLIHDAIALHTAVGIAPGRGPEVALVHFGTGCDVLGLRLDEIPPLVLARTLEEWPRLSFKTAFPPLLNHQVQMKPNCHIAGHLALGLVDRFAAAPFEE